MIEHILYEGVSWGLENAILSEQEFIENGLREGQYWQFSENDQRKLLSQTYELLMKMVLHSG